MSSIRDRLPTPPTHSPVPVRFSRRRRVPAVVVHPDLRVEVVAPFGTPPEVIESLFTESAPWIERTLLRFRERLEAVRERRYAAGEAFLLGGEEHHLVIETGEPATVRAGDGTLCVALPQNSTTEEARALVIAFYRERALETIGGLLAVHAPRFDCAIPPFRVKLLRRRWGSCSRAGRLNFNLRLAMAPQPLVEYVVVHELSHLLHPDHSPAFWRTVGQHLPDFPARRRALREAGPLYIL